ncbi:hypothetical protein BJ085DRAFT_27134 [Dimargaris cristalligena]|uniref:Uncharacterized protein n=1 Tax=Dimargaris cristalligena TaxID=215637 RepID=A0A4P9ZW94_9FUNG|nr:hypothetical protein BJ085DRAFT_27134 [Dimargaris cristalligena]|eukprot:RKP37887.1 hypothetical protein BJ085DRAFT_27134 [Dimargaris cristalligena]
MNLKDTIVAGIIGYLTTSSSPLYPSHDHNSYIAKPTWFESIHILPHLIKSDMVERLDLSAYLWWAPVLLNTDSTNDPKVPDKVSQFLAKLNQTLALNLSYPAVTSQVANELFKQFPLESTNAVFEKIVGIYPRLAQLAESETGLLHTQSNLFIEIGLFINRHYNTPRLPLFTRTNWKYVDLARLSPEEFARNFPVAHTANITILNQMAHLDSAIGEYEGPVGLPQHPNLDLLHLGINLMDSSEVVFYLDLVGKGVIQQMANVAIWHLYRTGQSAVLAEFMDLDSTSDNSNPSLIPYPMLYPAVNLLLALAAIQQDEDLIWKLTRRWIDDGTLSYQNEETGDAIKDQRDVLVCLRANGMQEAASYLQQLWNVQYQRLKPASISRATLCRGDRWLRVLPSGDMWLAYSAHHFKFSDEAIITEPGADPVNPAFEIIDLWEE